MMFDEEFIRDVTREVWSTVLGLSAEDGPVVQVGAEEITSSVDISGAWEGTVAVSFTRPLSRHIAAVMLACPESETSQALVEDVIGEIANVIGGNVKGILPGPTYLSLPRIEPDWVDKTSPGIVHQLWFDCAGHPFSVTVLAHQGQDRRRS